MELREIIVWFGLVAIVVIVWDGLRRMKTDRPKKRQAKAKKAKAFVPKKPAPVEEDEDDDWVDPEEAARQAQIARELPNGGARSRPMTDEEKAAVKARLNLRERVPMLMERVEVEEPEDTPAEANLQQTELDFSAALADAEAKSALAVTNRNEQDTESQREFSTDDDFSITISADDRIEPSFSAHTGKGEQADDSYNAKDEDDAESDLETEYETDYEPQEYEAHETQYDVAPESEAEPELESELEAVPEPLPDSATATAPKSQREDNEERNDPGPVEDLVVIHVMARNGGELSGSAVLELLLTAGLRHGPMEIFHYRNPQGYTEFSLANCVHPGTFDPDSMNQVNTPGVTLFMQLPTAANALESFEHMYEMAEYMARNLGADILDEDHSTVTKQRREYYREKLRAYTRSKLIPS